jgi:hypothetical protein
LQIFHVSEKYNFFVNFYASEKYNFFAKFLRYKKLASNFYKQQNSRNFMLQKLAQSTSDIRHLRYKTPPNLRHGIFSPDYKKIFLFCPQYKTRLGWSRRGVLYRKSTVVNFYKIFTSTKLAKILYIHSLLKYFRYIHFSATL